MDRARGRCVFNALDRHSPARRLWFLSCTGRGSVTRPSKPGPIAPSKDIPRLLSLRLFLHLEKGVPHKVVVRSNISWHPSHVTTDKNTPRTLPGWVNFTRQPQSAPQRREERVMDPWTTGGQVPATLESAARREPPPFRTEPRSTAQALRVLCPEPERGPRRLSPRPAPAPRPRALWGDGIDVLGALLSQP